MASSRSARKRQHRRNNRLSSLILLSFFLSVALLLIRIDINSSDSTTALQQEQCKSSCHSALANAQSRDSSNGTGNLASSALDAMFSIRDYEEGGDADVDADEVHDASSTSSSSSTSDQRQRRATRNSEDDSTSSSRTKAREGGNANSNSNANNEVYRNLGYRPKRLPRLIETLVGNIDGDLYEDGHNPNHNHRGHSSARKRARVIPEKTHGNGNGNGNSNSNKGGAEQQPRQTNDRYQYYTGDDIDSVAMVAAAAATAVWSETASASSTSTSRTSRWGSMRMKAYNDEWEEALRWISTWGPQNQQKHGHRHEQEQHRQYRDGGRSKVGQQQVKRRPSDDRSSTAKSYSDLHDICVKRCLRDEWEWDPDPDSPRLHTTKERGVHKSSATKGNTNNTIREAFTGMGIGHILSQREFPRISISLRRTFSFHSIREVFRNIFGVMLSGAVLWFFRNMHQWWALNRYTSSLQSLLKEEAAGNVVKGKQGKKLNHTGRKKTKQRKKHRVGRGRGKDGHVTSPDNANAKDEVRWSPSSNGDDSDSDDSFDRIYMMRGKRQHSNTIDSNSDQASKETMETASCTTLDSGKVNTGGSQGFSQLDTRANRKSIQNKEWEAKTPDPCDRLVYISTENCPVPSDAQREQAYQKLKAFQRAQLQKLVENLKRAKTVPSAAGKATSSTSKEPISTICKDFRSPPPGLSTNTTSGGAKTKKKSFTDALLGKQPKEKSAVDLMLSSLLDDGEDDENIDALSLTSGNAKVTNTEVQSSQDQNQLRPIALGDLLLGTFGGETSNTTFITQPKSNPWQKSSKSFDDSSYKADLGSSQDEILHSDSTDANIQLQVSATEFMPKWGEGTYTSSNSRIW